MIAFPPSPEPGEAYTENDRTWIFNADIPAWEEVYRAATAIVLSDTPPVVSGDGELWRHTASGQTYVRQNNAWAGGIAMHSPAEIKRMAFLGDSLSFAHGTNDDLGARNYETAFRGLSLNRFGAIRHADGSEHWGYGGYKATDIMAQGIADELLAQCEGPSDAVYVFLGANDISNGATGQTAADNVIAVWDKLLAGGVTVIGCEIIPHSDGAFAAVKAITNPLLATAAKERNMRFVAWHDVLGVAADWESPDTVHPSAVGYMKLGAFLANAMDSRLAAYSPRVLATRNQELAGANVGNSWLPTGFTRAVGAGVQLTLPGYVAATDGGGQWLEFTVTASTGIGAIQFTTPALTIFDGTEFRGSGEIQTEFTTGQVSADTTYGNSLCSLQETSSPATTITYFDWLFSTDQATKFLASGYNLPLPHVRTETLWMPLNHAVDWHEQGGLKAYFTLYLSSGAVAKVRFRNLGIEVR